MGVIVKMDYFYNMFKPKTVAWTLGKSDIVVNVPVKLFLDSWREGVDDKRFGSKQSAVENYDKYVRWYSIYNSYDQYLALAEIRLAACNNHTSALKNICPYYT